MILAAAITCMALNIYHEARGEDLIGQHAVAKVTWNRAHEDKRNVCAVVVKRKQFSWTNNGNVKLEKGMYVLDDKMLPKNVRAWKTALMVAKLTMANATPNFLHGATYYHADYVRPAWSRSRRMTKVAVIGQHIFYKLA